MNVVLSDDASANLYTAAANEYSVIHALYLSNKSTTSSATVNIKVSTDNSFCNKLKNIYGKQNIWIE